MRCVVGFAAMAASLAATLAAGAQEAGEPMKGLAVAQRLCVKCHAVFRNQARSPNLAAPPFATIAAVPGMTAIALSSMLQSSHRTMPNLNLEAEDLRNVIAYILSLQAER